MTDSLVEMLNALRSQIKEDTEKSLKQVEENITQKINEKLEEKFNKVEADINKIQNTQIEQEKRLDDFDRRLRQRNLIFFGIAEEEKNYSELEDLVLNIINFKMEVGCDRKEMEFVGRMGKKNTKPRPIRLTLTTYGKKIALLQRKSTLEGSGSYIKEDFPPKVLEKRKALIPQLLEHKQKGNLAMLKYDQLIVKDKPNNKRALSVSPSEKQGSTYNNNKPADKFRQILKKTKTFSATTSNNKQSKNTKPLQSLSPSITSYMKKTPQSEKGSPAANQERE